MDAARSAQGGIMADLTRRGMIKTAGVTVAAIGVTSVPRPVRRLFSDPAARPRSPDVPWNNDPESPIGPPNWDTIGFPVCGLGMTQSPVDIRTDRLAKYPGGPLLLSYEKSEAAVVNTGHYVEVPIPPGVDDTLDIDGDLYRLLQYHFHAPSEHAVNSHLADLEAHFVHKNAHGATAVVGVFFNIGSDPNPLLDTILLSAPETAGHKVIIGKASPADLFHDLSGVRTTPTGAIQVESFYSYEGSLTTPDCAEGLRWSVLVGTGQVSHAAVMRFHQLIARFPDYNGYPNNNRPLQPLNGRIISARFGP
jgi:carbonic anhydrase